MNSFSGDAMDVAELVRTVVLEVLERIDGQTPRLCVRVLADRDEALVRRIAPLVFPFFGENTDILFTGEDNGGRTPQKYLLPELSCSDMADLASGRASSPLMEEILGLLLHGTEGKYWISLIDITPTARRGRSMSCMPPMNRSWPHTDSGNSAPKRPKRPDGENL